MPRGAAFTLERGLHVPRVLLGLEDKEIHPAGEEAGGLLVKGGPDPVEGDPAGHRDGLGGGTERAGGEARAGRSRELGRSLAGELGGNTVELARPLGQPILGEDDRGPAEGVALDDVGARRQVAAVDIQDHVRAGQDQMLVATLELGTAEVGSAELRRLDRRAHGAVEYEDPLPQELLDEERSLLVWVHVSLPSWPAPVMQTQGARGIQDRVSDRRADGSSSCVVGPGGTRLDPQVIVAKHVSYQPWRPWRCQPAPSAPARRPAATRPRGLAPRSPIGPTPRPRAPSTRHSVDLPRVPMY
jgi:hypothetical protein